MGHSDGSRLQYVLPDSKVNVLLQSNDSTLVGVQGLRNKAQACVPPYYLTLTIGTCADLGL
jgi:hypothetical protein